jgi:hypothetical protein
MQASVEHFPEKWTPDFRKMRSPIESRAESLDRSIVPVHLCKAASVPAMDVSSARNARMGCVNNR